MKMKMKMQMMEDNISIQNAFERVKDFRQPQGRRYKLQAVLALSCLAVLHGARSEQAIAEWSGNDGRRWLGILGIRRRKGPSAATIGRILKGVDRTQVEAALRDWSSHALGSANASEGGVRIDERESPDSFHTISRWIENLNESLQPIENRNEDSTQHISEAGLKMWGIDLDSFTEPVYTNNQLKGAHI